MLNNIIEDSIHHFIAVLCLPKTQTHPCMTMNFTTLVECVMPFLSFTLEFRDV